MAKILIAGLGGGVNQNSKDDGKKTTKRYSVATYEIEGVKYPESPFITTVLEEHYKIDKTIYIGTVGSIWDILYSHYCKKYGIEEDDDYELEMMNVIDESKKIVNLPIENLDLTKFNETFKGKIEGRLTKYGMNDSEIFENFNIIMNLSDVLHDGDEVYIDITHSFRSNAMWMFLILNFINDVMDRNITIKAITYGMLEVRGANNGVAPVVNLQAFYRLMKWIKGANAFKNYGNSYDLLDILPDEDIKKKLKNFSEGMNMNYVASIKESVDSLRKIKDKIDAVDGPGKFLIPDIVRSFLDEFDGLEKEYEIQARLAKWHFKQKRYAMAYINLNEAIKGFTEQELKEFPYKGYDVDEDDSNYFIKAKKFYSSINRIAESCRATKRPCRLKDEYPVVWNFYTIYSHSLRVRNEIAHSLGKKSSQLNDITSLKNHCEKIEELLSKRGEIRIAEYNMEFLKK